MNKILLTGILALLIFTGCSKSPQVFMSKDLGTVYADIYIHNGMSFKSLGINESEAFRNAFETAARVTIEKGYKYFAVVSPKEISTIKGSLKNTAPEILKACETSGFLILKIKALGAHKCGTKETSAYMKIAMYKEEQDGFLVIDANEIIKYFNNKDLYDGRDIKYRK